MTTRQQLIERAQDLFKGHKQYDGHFDNYVLVRIKKNVTTKMGQAFEKGEVTIASPVHHPVLEGRSVFSFKNGIDTLLDEKDFTVLKG